MTVSLIWVYVVYMFTPKQEIGEENGINTWDLQAITWDVQIEEILPEELLENEIYEMQFR